jgi:hypothetical protein
MSGEVVTFAQQFEGDGVFPYPKRALGCFEISASRNALMVHRAEITDADDLSVFQTAMKAAWEKRRELSQNR